MDYIRKLQKVDEHLQEHPHDYQAVIARMKLYSKAVEQQHRQVAIERLKKVAEYRRLLNEKSQ